MPFIRVPTYHGEVYAVILLLRSYYTSTGILERTAQKKMRTRGVHFFTNITFTDDSQM